MRNQANIRHNADRVQLIVDGKLVLDLPYQAALEIAGAMHYKAKLAEEYTKAEAIVFDAAILIRSGAPIGLSNNLDILKEARKEAVYNSQLRRYMPSIKSCEAFGTPIITQKDKKDV